MKSKAARALIFMSGLAIGFVTAPSPGQAGAEDGEWRHHGGDQGASLYSPLDQINASNVKDLQIAWRWKSPDAEVRETIGDDRVKRARIYHYESTPLKVGDRLYVTTSMGQVAALDPQTGETIWKFDPKAYDEGLPTNLGFLSRGLTYWTDGTIERLFHAPTSAYIYSIDPKTGAVDPNFGENGRVDMTQGLGFAGDDRETIMQSYTIASPPVVCRDVVIVGSSIKDTPTRREIPPGHIRGYDARTGKQLWIFHTIPKPGEFGNDTWEQGSWSSAGSVNAWPPMSADEELGYVYIPVGTPSHNWYGGHRPGDNLFSCSIVCLDAKSGQRVWHYQLIHHSIWDYDPPAAPRLIDITVAGKPIKAVVVLTKQGLLFTFDRVTGEPVWPIEERPVPQSTVPGEKTAPTQPFPTKPAPFEPPGATEDMLIDLTPELKAEALKMAQEWQLGTVYTPTIVPTGEKKGTIVNPGWAGGGNWNGAAFDPDSQILYVPSYTNYNLLWFEKPDAARSNFDYVWGGAQTPTIDGLPIFKPPFSRMTAIDMKTGDHLWQVANGSGPRDHEKLKGLDLPPLGRAGGDGESFPLLTKTLLLTTLDRSSSSPPMLRAIDKATGETVAEIELPATVHATPMTYMSGGKQYIAVSLGGGLYSRINEPDELIALSLP